MEAESIPMGMNIYYANMVCCSNFPNSRKQIYPLSCKEVILIPLGEMLSPEVHLSEMNITPIFKCDTM